MGKINIIALSDTLHEESYIKRILNTFQKSAPDIIDFKIVDIAHIPAIHQVEGNNLPESVKKIHHTVRNADAVFFAASTHNGFYSSVIKNAIDWGIRLEGTNVWDSKPAGVIEHSLNMPGTLCAIKQLRKDLLQVNMLPLKQLEFYLNEIATALDEYGNIISAEAQRYIDTCWHAFENWIKKVKYAHAES